MNGTTHHVRDHRPAASWRSSEAVIAAQRPPPEATASDTIAGAARQIAETLDLSAIICWTNSGSTALRVARERPNLAGRQGLIQSWKPSIHDFDSGNRDVQDFSGSATRGIRDRWAYSRTVRACLVSYPVSSAALPRQNSPAITASRNNGQEPLRMRFARASSSVQISMRRRSSAGSRRLPMKSGLVNGRRQEEPAEFDQTFHGQVTATIEVAASGLVGRL